MAILEVSPYLVPIPSHSIKEYRQIKDNIFFLWCLSSTHHGSPYHLLCGPVIKLTDPLLVDCEVRVVFFYLYKHRQFVALRNSILKVLSRHQVAGYTVMMMDSRTFSYFSDLLNNLEKNHEHYIF